VVENDEVADRELMQYIYHLSVQNQLLEHQLLEHQLQGTREALTEKAKMKDRQKVLPLYAHTLEWHGGARWWSPSSKAEADAREAAYEAYTAEQEAAKATERKLNKTQKLLKDKRNEQACVQCAREKDEQEKKLFEGAPVSASSYALVSFFRLVYVLVL
jgi:multidrug efflux pump subunit AcrA (membrane-fusion protein)